MSPFAKHPSAKRANPFVAYTLARFGLFLAAAAVLLLLPIQLNVYLRLGIALLISAALAYLLLRRLRDDAANRLAAVSLRRQERRERLRAALAGEDESPTHSSTSID